MRTRYLNGVRKIHSNGPIEKNKFFLVCLILFVHSTMFHAYREIITVESRCRSVAHRSLEDWGGGRKAIVPCLVKLEYLNAEKLHTV